MDTIGFIIFQFLDKSLSGFVFMSSAHKAAKAAQPWAAITTFSFHLTFRICLHFAPFI